MDEYRFWNISEDFDQNWNYPAEYSSVILFVDYKIT